MCGIGGCVVRPGRVPDREALERLARALYHRGPDDHGVEVVGQVGLAHARLSIVDPSPLGHQPMSGDGGRWWLAYNGEIFNHVDLRARYADAPYRGGSDTETLLHALMADGEEAIGRCNGLYAYAALDVERGRLLLVRDRFGVKPLYLAEHDGDLWFASEIRALLAAGVPARVDRDGLRYASFGGYLTGPDQWLTPIRQLLPGEVATVDVASGAIGTRSWFEPADLVDPELARELANMPRAALVDRLEETLRVAVRRRLMSDVPLGTMCSGGMDSSLITAFARD